MRRETRPADVPRPLPRKLYRVSELADYVGVTRQTIHNWATIGLITEEERTPGGQKLYDAGVFETLLRIRRLKATHRLSEIRRMLDERATPSKKGTCAARLGAERGGR